MWDRRGPSALRYSTGKRPGCLGTALRLRKRRGCFGRNRRTAAANRPDQRPEKAASRFSFGSRLQPEHQFAPAGGAEDEVVAPGSPAGMGEAQQRSGSAAFQPEPAGRAVPLGRRLSWPRPVNRGPVEEAQFYGASGRGLNDVRGPPLAEILGPSRRAGRWFPAVIWMAS
jgi:hypothetical protein